MPRLWIKLLTVIVCLDYFKSTAVSVLTDLTQEELLRSKRSTSDFGNLHNIRRKLLGSQMIADVTLAVLRAGFRSLSELTRKRKDEFCYINVKLLTMYHPLIIEPADHTKLKYPDDNGGITFKKDEDVFLSCANQNFEKYKVKFKNYKCRTGSYFYSGNDEDYFYDLKCAGTQSSTYHTDGLKHFVSVGEEKFSIHTHKHSFVFKVDSAAKSVPIFNVIRDANNSTRQFHHSISIISKTIKGGQVIENNLRINDKLFYEDHANAVVCYQPEKQSLSLEYQLVSSKNLFCAGKDRIVQAHLSHPTSMVYETMARQLLLYQNTVPQWEIINEKNWAGINQHVKNMAIKLKRDLTIITGVHDKLQVRNRDNTGEKPLYLDFHLNETSLRKLNVIPLYFFKMIIDKQDQSGVVFVTVNNPHIKNPALYELCEDAKFPTFTVEDPAVWEPKKLEYGYSYTCSIKEFYEGSGYLYQEDIAKDITKVLNVEI